MTTLSSNTNAWIMSQTTYIVQTTMVLIYDEILLITRNPWRWLPAKNNYRPSRYNKINFLSDKGMRSSGYIICIASRAPGFNSREGSIFVIVGNRMCNFIFLSLRNDVTYDSHSGFQFQTVAVVQCQQCSPAKGKSRVRNPMRMFFWQNERDYFLLSFRLSFLQTTSFSFPFVLAGLHLSFCFLFLCLFLYFRPFSTFSFDSSWIAFCLAFSLLFFFSDLFVLYFYFDSSIRQFTTWRLFQADTLKRVFFFLIILFLKYRQSLKRSDVQQIWSDDIFVFCVFYWIQVITFAQK